MKAVHVRFKETGKIYHFSSEDFTLTIGDKVIVETVRGLELGVVVKATYELLEDIVFELKPVVRLATHEDIKLFKSNIADEPAVLEKSKLLVKKNNLDIKIVSAEYTLDRSKLIISFDSEQRVDFRELVRDLASEYRSRIELRQIGPRDSAKVVGGLGICGLVVCCNKFLGSFSAVSMKMARNQNLSMNPQKISGICGKLLCCLAYENNLYTEASKDAPKEYAKYLNKDGIEEQVVMIDLLGRKATVKLNDTYQVRTFDEISKMEKVPYASKKPVSK